MTIDADPRQAHRLRASPGPSPGFAGSLYVVIQGGIFADAFDAEVSIRLFSMVVIGGLSTIPGAILGAAYVRGAEFFLPAQWSLIASGVRDPAAPARAARGPGRRPLPDPGRGAAADRRAAAASTCRASWPTGASTTTAADEPARPTPEPELVDA